MNELAGPCPANGRGLSNVLFGTVITNESKTNLLKSTFCLRHFKIIPYITKGLSFLQLLRFFEPQINFFSLSKNMVKRQKCRLMLGVSLVRATACRNALEKSFNALEKHTHRSKKLKALIVRDYQKNFK